MQVAFPSVDVLVLGIQTDHRVDAFEGRHDDLEIGYAGLQVWDTLDGTPVQAAEIVLVGQTLSSNGAACAGKQYLLLGGGNSCSLIRNRPHNLPQSTPGGETTALLSPYLSGYSRRRLSNTTNIAEYSKAQRDRLSRKCHTRPLRQLGAFLSWVVT